MNKKGVCGSYADTFVYMDRKAGLDALIVSGKATVIQKQTMPGMPPS